MKSKHIKLVVTSLLLLLTLPLAISAVNAHTPAWTIITNAYVYAPIDPIGVGQPASVYVWVDKVFDSAAIGNDYRFRNYKLTIIAPDGTTQTKTWDITWDSTSNAYYSFTPTQIGKYTLNFNFPGQAINDYSHSPTSAYVNDTYSASSATTTLTVQQTPISWPPAMPLPSEYWARPIYGENVAWWSVSSNWLGTGAPGYGGYGVSPNLGGNLAPMYPGDAVGPQTSHIMWTKPYQSGGVVGGNNFAIQGNQYYEGSAYNQRFTNPIIVNGKLYYKDVVSFTGNNAGPLNCVDLRTGQLIWSRTDLPALSFALIWDHEDPNQHGVYPAILFTSNFGRAFDADTGNPLFNVTGVPSGYLNMVFGPNAEMIKYVLANAGNNTNPDWRLGQWNSTKLWSFTGLSPSIVATANTSSGMSVDAAISVGASSRYDWNVSIPWRSTMPASGAGSPTVIGAIYNDVLLMYNGTLPGKGGQFMGSLSWQPYTYFAVNLNPTKGQVGSILWTKTYDPPIGNLTVLEEGVDPVNRVFVENLRETMQWVGYSLDSGQRIWGPTASQTSLDYYGSQASGSLAGELAYGKLYSSAYGGILYAYDTKDGKLLWTYGNGGEGNSTQSGFEVPGHYPTFINAIGNGIVYTVTSEHTVQTPIYQGALMRAINATDGTEIWTLSNDNNEFMTMSYAIADGFAITFNAYDNQIYSIGRGPSSTSVTVQNDVIPLGNTILIKGIVTDVSSGTRQNEQIARFPNGVPVVADASMKDWMGYVYQQKPRPTNTQGVTVILSERDSNGNVYTIGNVTTDATGAYHLMWQPPIPGDYTIYATFAGTNSYWPSSAETAIGVTEAPQPTPAVPTATPTLAPTLTPTTAPTATIAPTSAPSPTGGLAVETYIAIAAVVIIALVAAAAVVLRKRK